MMKTNRLHGPSDPRNDLESWGATAGDMGRQAVMPDIWGSLNTGAAAFVGGVASLPSQALYLTETGDTAAISVNDLHQGQIGDCFLISSVGELALTHPDAIGKMIRSNADGTETVTLYVDQRGRLPTFGTTAFKPVSVTVSNVFPSYSINNGATQDMVANTKEIWPQILEKAVATLHGGYGAIAYGGNPVIPMS